ncbi:hypothetical protein O4H49_20050 [Kiloniella laminariae]|uniref:Lysozyme inhibitor LprI N-terminal domain-containing protein n=1 Tax=Kiloniella laminariae TaxID=454162 RepID=A0ABT4LPM8_9PROT|nr:hypothetical protein [Kiloniella laminariae]MCZ4283088.1 hypothetical protein [Kiloniella laminariae]
MKKIIQIAFGLCFIAIEAQAISFSSKPYIDPVQLKNDQLFTKRKLAECGRGVDLVCFKRVRQQWRDEGRSRGSNEYCDIHLVPETSESLKKIYRELSNIKGGDGIDRKPGEVTQADIDNEKWCIGRILEERGDD